jgi:antitoxin (DNA-binding transcriptional repressor) of toxin-antitoxin stability system
LNRLSKYLTFAKGGEEVVIRDRDLPVAKLVPFIGEEASEQDLLLVAAGKIRLPQIRLDVKKLSKIPTGSVKGNKAIQAVFSDQLRRFTPVVWWGRTVEVRSAICRLLRAKENQQ